MFYGTENSKSETENNTEANLNNKLNNAFSDLDILKRELKTIRRNNDELIPQITYKSNKRPLNRPDLFSDERYKNVLTQIKESNTEKSKLNRPVNFSKEKQTYSNIDTKLKNNQFSSNNFIGKN